MSHTYAGVGVDIDATDAAKRNFAASVDRGDTRVLNRSGAFASLVEARFDGYLDPVLVFKTDEPGSKQILALDHGRIASLCRDLVNHLTNDVICMGATPLYIQDCIVCGRFDAAQVEAMVAGLADACHALGCVLVGGETSVQPGVVRAGAYVLSASAIGVVERNRVVDGNAIQEGDTLVALPSNGPHTNGYTLIRKLIEENPDLAQSDVDGQPFLEAVLQPHRSYAAAVRRLCDAGLAHGLAHITGGGLGGNIDRILPADCNAEIDLERLKIPAVFKTIRQAGQIPEADMLKTFNLGVGMVVVCDAKKADSVIATATELGSAAFICGRVMPGEGQVQLRGDLNWH
jgi:phosphoribosylformylglycinamidine cyclo-ligase